MALGTLPFGLAVAPRCLIGVGLLLLRPWVRLVRSVAELERRRFRALGLEMVSRYEPLPHGWRATLTVVRRDLSTRRDGHP